MQFKNSPSLSLKILEALPVIIIVNFGKEMPENAFCPYQVRIVFRNFRYENMSKQKRYNTAANKQQPLYEDENAVFFQATYCAENERKYQQAACQSPEQRQHEKYSREEFFPELRKR